MKINKSIFILFFALVISLIPINYSYSQNGPKPGRINFWNTDAGATRTTKSMLVYFFDLRERETFIQLTYPSINREGVFTNTPAVAHVQIFDVSNNCNENDFFDAYTVADTHVYNMRDIQTNDGNPSGVVLPDNAYGIVSIAVDSGLDDDWPQSAFGNMRIIDSSGYEYRTNALTLRKFIAGTSINDSLLLATPFYSFNFNKEAGVTFSDVVGITLLNFRNDSLLVRVFLDAQDVANTFVAVDVDIVDNSENIFSCRNVIFSCVDQEHPRLEELLENAGSASVASFEYGINNAIPHSKGGELLCPGNTIDEGFVKLFPLDIPSDILNTNNQKPDINDSFAEFFGFIGLNNGNGRGSFDSFWSPNRE